MTLVNLMWLKKMLQVFNIYIYLYYTCVYTCVAMYNKPKINGFLTRTRRRELIQFSMLIIFGRDPQDNRNVLFNKMERQDNNKKYFWEIISN